MRSYFCTLCAIAAALWVVSASAQPAPASLPLKRLRLYDSGVGYFERTGRIDGGSGGVSLPVPAGHLDDALKTLVVLSADGQTTVKGIEFRSSASRPLALALAGLPNDPDAALSYDSLIGSLKGAPVELRTARTAFRGRLIEVLPGDQQGATECIKAAKLTAEQGGQAELGGLLARCTAAGSSTLLLLTDKGEIRSFTATEVRSVRPTDPAFQSRLTTALDTLSQRGSQTRRDLRLQAVSGKAVTLGYVAEAPIWRSTYRLVLADEPRRGTLQGWALLHNDTDEPWSSVRVELVNGRPDSFLFPLAAPRYARREMVTPERELSTVPQLLDTTVDNMWGDAIGESYGAGGLGLTGIGSGGGGRGEGIGLGSIGTIGHGAGIGRGSGAAQSGLLAVGSLAPVQEAEGVEAGALFRYSLPAPVDLRAHGSALMPFLNRGVSARRIAVLGSPGDTARSAVHLKNDTQQTLPPGTIAIFADGGFAGESALSRTKPTESRIVGFGFDLDVELTHQGTTKTDTPKVLAFDGTRLTVHFVRRHHLTYQLVNRSGSQRTVYLRLPFVRNSQVTGVDGTAFDSETDVPYAVFESKPKHRGNREMDVREGLRRTHDFGKLTSKMLQRMADANSVAEAQRQVLAKAAGELRAGERLRASKPKIQAGLREAEADVTRLRVNVRALRGDSGDAAETFGERLLAAADRARALRAKLKRVDSDVQLQRGRAQKTLRKLSTRKGTGR